VVQKQRLFSGHTAQLVNMGFALLLVLRFSLSLDDDDSIPLFVGVCASDEFAAGDHDFDNWMSHQEVKSHYCWVVLSVV